MPVTGRGFLPRSADTPCCRDCQDGKVFEDGLALDPLNTEEKEPQKYIRILFKQLPHLKKKVTLENEYLHNSVMAEC